MVAGSKNVLDEGEGTKVNSKNRLNVGVSTYMIDRVSLSVHAGPPTHGVISMHRPTCLTIKLFC